MVDGSNILSTQPLPTFQRVGPAPAADELTALRERVAVLTAAVERARRHAQNIGITDGSYIAQLDAAISAAIGEDIGGGRG